MATFISHSPRETEQLGETLAALARPGWVIALSGDLGAGKTRFVKGFARGLGIQNRVQSPTFSLVQEYRDGRIPLFHLDLYRLAGTPEILGAGLEEYFTPTQGVSVIEWYERWDGPPPPLLCRVVLSHRGDDQRLVEYDLPRP